MVGRTDGRPASSSTTDTNTVGRHKKRLKAAVQQTVACDFVSCRKPAAQSVTVYKIRPLLCLHCYRPCVFVVHLFDTVTCWLSSTKNVTTLAFARCHCMQVLTSLHAARRPVASTSVSGVTAPGLINVLNVALFRGSIASHNDRTVHGP
jgi:hypothetical protein